MPLQPGDRLPRLELRANGRPFRLEPGPGGLLVYFMRSADCPVCRAHVKRLVALWPQLSQQGFAVGVVVPEGDRDLAVAQSLRTPFPVAEGVQAHSTLGLRRTMFDLVQQSGTVVTDRDGVIVHLQRATMPTSALDEDAVLALLTPAAPRPLVARTS